MSFITSSLNTNNSVIGYRPDQMVFRYHTVTSYLLYYYDHAAIIAIIRPISNNSSAKIAGRPGSSEVRCNL